MKLLSYLVMLFILSSIAFADISISSLDVKPSFSLGEQMRFSFTIVSSTDTEVVYTPYIYCQTAPHPFLEEKTVSLNANIPYNGEYSDLVVSDDIEPQTCTASISIKSPTETFMKKEFQINTLPSLKENIGIGSSAKAESVQKVYKLGDTFNLNAEGNKVDAQLTYPSGKKVSAANAKLDEIGAYTLSYSIDKPGFKIKQQQLKLAVIDKSATPKDASVLPVKKAVTTSKTMQVSKNLIGKAFTIDELQNIGQYTEGVPFILFIITIIVSMLVLLIKQTKNK